MLTKMRTKPVIIKSSDDIIDIDLGNHLGEETKINEKGEDTNVFFSLGNQLPESITSPKSQKTGTAFWAEKEPPPVALPQTPQMPEEKISEVNGSVLAIDEANATCEIYLRRGNTEIYLPLNLFPEPPIYGMTFSLSVDEASGIRQPVVKLRKPNLENLSDDNKKMDALINNF